jgi:hypothetical protein
LAGRGPVRRHGEFVVAAESLPDSHLIERGLEEEGANANAALWALIDDYLQQARQFDAIPLEVGILD